VTPVDDITVEVKEEGLEHQLFFQAAEAMEPFARCRCNGKTRLALL
jgi:hypothetical protein